MRTARTAFRVWVPVSLAAFVMVGCRDEVGDVPPPKIPKYPDVSAPQATASAGIPVAPGPETLVVDLVSKYHTQSRPDPWALQQNEKAFEVKERNARVFATEGSLFPALFVPQVERASVAEQEPQPYRRLAGVLVGESVMAIIDMGDGRPMELIRPGMQIPNSPWRVISIDEDKAVLRRSGNKLPKEVVVRLETPAFSPGTVPNQPGDQELPGNRPGGAQPGGAPAGGGRRGGKGGGAGAGGGGGE